VEEGHQVHENLCYLFGNVLFRNKWKKKL